MPCEIWRSKLDAYADGELPTAEADLLGAHLRKCAACAAEVLGKMQVKRAVAAAGRRYEPDEQLRAKIAKTIGAKPVRQGRSPWSILAIPALALLLISLGVTWYVERDLSRRQRLYGELADLHVTTLASANPVDVVSTDRHTVKPWFEGKIPFSFNLPDLGGTEFSLSGGRVTYLAQTPGAQLIYHLRKHEISVFIFQDRGEAAGIAASGPVHTLSFTEESWRQNGLRYFVVGDVGAEDIESLSKLLKSAG